MERLRDAGRGRPRRLDADRADRGPRGGAVCRAATRRRGRRPDDRGAGTRPTGRRAGDVPAAGRSGHRDAGCDARPRAAAGRRGGGAMTARIVPDDDAGRAAAIDVLRHGGVVALPTDTVYGIAVALETEGGIERL